MIKEIYRTIVVAVVMILLGQLILFSTLLELHQYNRYQIAWGERITCPVEKKFPLTPLPRIGPSVYYNNTSLFLITNLLDYYTNPELINYYLVELNFSEGLTALSSNSSYKLPNSIRSNTSQQGRFISLQYFNGTFWTILTENPSRPPYNYSIVSFSKNMIYYNQRFLQFPISDAEIQGMAIWDNSLWLIIEHNTANTNLRSITRYSLDTLEEKESVVLPENILEYYCMDETGIFWFYSMIDISTQGNTWVRFPSENTLIGFSLNQSDIHSVIHRIRRLAYNDDVTLVWQRSLIHISISTTSIQVDSTRVSGYYLLGIVFYPLTQQVPPIVLLWFWIILTVTGLTLMTLRVLFYYLFK